MKKLISLLLVLVLLLSALPLAQANSLPHGIDRYFSDPQFAGCKIGNWALIEDCCFVNLVDAKGVNTIFGFHFAYGAWNYWMRTHKGVPQGKGTLQVETGYEYRDHRTGQVKYTYPTLTLSLQGSSEHTAWYCFTGKIWKLMRYINAGKKLCVTVGDTQLSYFSGNGYQNKKGTAEGSIQRDLRYVSLSTIPASYADAQGHLSTEPELPYSRQLAAQDVNFTGGKKYPVYSAPNKNSYRSANGKAAVSTNGWIQVFGKEDGFILIQYAIDANHCRFGYIDSKSLPKKASIPALDFDHVDVTVGRDVSVTDDPFYSQAAIAKLHAGDSVLYLAGIGDWAYVECSNGSCRGFIPMSAISSATDPDSVG